MLRTLIVSAAALVASVEAHRLHLLRGSPEEVPVAKPSAEEVDAVVGKANDALAKLEDDLTHLKANSTTVVANEAESESESESESETEDLDAMDDEDDMELDAEDKYENESEFVSDPVDMDRKDEDGTEDKDYSDQMVFAESEFGANAEKRRYYGRWVRRDDSTSVARCPNGWIARACYWNGPSDGAYLVANGRACVARGSWHSQRHRRNVRAVANCMRRRGPGQGGFRAVFRRNGNRVSWNRGRRWSFAHCPRNTVRLACTCHSYWTKCRSNGRRHGRRGCKTWIRRDRHRNVFGTTYAICGVRNKLRRQRRKMVVRRPRKNSLKRGRRGSGKKGKNPLDQMERTLNRVDRSLKKMENQLKRIQRQR